MLTMVSHESLCLLVTIFAGIFVILANARSWDFAVVIGREIDFFARNGTLTGQAVIAEAVSLTGVAYDDITRTMYLSDKRNNVSIFSNDLTQKNMTSYPLVERENGTQILGLAFDTSSRTLFWTDALKQVIMKMHVPVDGPPESPVLLHNLTNESPRGIALDVCNSYIYWVNSNSTNPSIERSRLDGSERITVISENLYEPLGIAVDHEDGKLYWSDDEEGIHFKIERSNLDGSNREILVHHKHQNPVSMAVDGESIYWTDWVHNAIWTIRKDTRPGDVPVKLKSYYETNRYADPAGIIARDNVGSVDCAAVAMSLEKRTKSMKSASLPAVIESYNNLTTSTEESSDLTTETSAYCLNDGHLDRRSGSCRCRPGYSGSACETSLCYNYCFHGKCSINGRGMPQCECDEAFSGPRCEKDVCDGYCLHNGQCSVQNGMPACKCKYFEGKRCEVLRDLTEICAMLCAGVRLDPTAINVDSCKCTEASLSAEKVVAFSDNFEYKTLLPILTALIVILILLIALLSFYVNKLRRRPRIKKRFVVSKGGVTPLTSRPQIPDNQCEITIENCCNMNICETPCFEPKLRSTISRNNNVKKEEKNSLLDNMEHNSC